MSTYVIADVHGMYDQYMSILDKIDFGDSDTLYVLGDILDRGPNGIKVLQHMIMEPGIVPIIGNHEYIACRCLVFLMKEVTEENILSLEGGFLEGMLQWKEIGGDVTITEFRKLRDWEREDIMEYIRGFIPYEEVSVGGRNYVLVHAGLKNFAPQRPLDDYNLDELIFESPDYNRVYYKDKFLVTGHRPTRGIEGAESDRVYICNNHIAIDCGAVYGGRLAAVRLDDLKVFYSDD